MVDGTRNVASLYRRPRARPAAEPAIADEPTERRRSSHRREQVQQEEE
jgi:hypothetical protein